jgi:putative transposase
MGGFLVPNYTREQMPKFRRLIVQGYPHHVTQRGVRRQPTFFKNRDYQAYIAIASNQLVATEMDILAYCLMPNHVHFVVVPHAEGALSKYFCEVHKRYARRTNQLFDWKGHLWQQRFYSVVMDEPHALAAMRYVELNPVRAGLVRHASDWQWSSARVNLGMASDQLVDRRATVALIPNWAEYLDEPVPEAELEMIRNQTKIGRPNGNDGFIAKLEARTGRQIRRRARGRQRNKGS